MEEQYYTTREAAEYLRIPIHRMYDLRATGAVPGEIIDAAEYKGSKYRFKQGDLDKWANRKSQEAVVVLTRPEPEPAPLSDEDIMHRILTELYTFLRQFEYPLGIKAMCKVDPGAMQLWAIETTDIDLHVVTEGEEICVISPQNQKYLEMLNSELVKRLKAAETLLAFMRKHPRDYILTEYSEEIVVQIEPREKGVLVTCEKFPMIGAIGPTEDEALTTFKGLLFGYAYHLRTHEAELTQSMKELFTRLKGIRAEV